MVSHDNVLFFYDTDLFLLQDLLQLSYEKKPGFFYKRPEYRSFQQMTLSLLFTAGRSGSFILPCRYAEGSLSDAVFHWRIESHFCDHWFFGYSIHSF